MGGKYVKVFTVGYIEEITIGRVVKYIEVLTIGWCKYVENNTMGCVVSILKRSPWGRRAYHEVEDLMWVGGKYV